VLRLFVRPSRLTHLPTDIVMHHRPNCCRYGHYNIDNIMLMIMITKLLSRWCLGGGGSGCTSRTSSQGEEFRQAGCCGYGSVSRPGMTATHFIVLLSVEANNERPVAICSQCCSWIYYAELMLLLRLAGMRWNGWVLLGLAS